MTDDTDVVINLFNGDNSFQVDKRTGDRRMLFLSSIQHNEAS